MILKGCPKCHARVLPMSNGNCPNCGEAIAEPYELSKPPSQSPQANLSGPTSEPRPEGQTKSDSPTESRFSGLDGLLLTVLIVVYIPLSLWGGSQHWAGSADILPFIMLGVGAVYVVFESVRLFSPGIVPILSALVPIFAVGPSLFFYPRDAGGLPAAVLVGYLFGLVTSTICWAIKSKKVSPLSEWVYWMGIHSLFVTLLAIPAIVYGHIAIRKVSSDDYFAQDRIRRGRAIAYVVLILWVIAILILASRA